MSPKKPSKILQDSVLGIIEVGPIMLHFIDTPEFQRLRRLHQLGLTYLVYPDCTHTRFEHCLGTYQLSKRLVEAIQNDSSCAAVHFNAGECLSIMIAALCHDLGHGPFSHVWEGFLKAGGPQYEAFKHEEMSCLILRRIVSRDVELQKLLQQNGVDLDLVCALIRGEPTPELKNRLKEKSYIFEIVSNSANGNDVDKWDYIMRDSLHAGLGQGPNVIEFERLLRFYRPAYVESDQSWHMAFRDSETENVLRIFSQRLTLHRKVYSHKSARAVEAMFLDIFNLLDPILHLRELSLRASRGDEAGIKEFLQLDEHSLWVMASSQFPILMKGLSGFEENLRKSEQLCQRIQFRQFYSVVGKFYKKSTVLSNVDKSYSMGNELVSAEDMTYLDGALDNEETRKGEAINADVLGSDAEILEGIFAKLPPGSPVKSVNELRLVSSAQSSNSTDRMPVFFAYRCLPEGFSFTRSVSIEQKFTKMYCCLVLWTGEVDDGRQSRGPAPVPLCLVEALESWVKEKREQSSPNRVRQMKAR